MNLSGFKAYDIRGRVPDVIDEHTAKQIGYAYALEFKPKQVVIGHDARLSGPALYRALSDGLRAAGVDVTGIGMCGTEEIYHAVFAKGFDGGIMVTGSHNPADENGFKAVRKNAVPISADSGLFAVRDRIAAGLYIPDTLKGTFTQADFRAEYIDLLLGYITPRSLKKFKIVADAGNGCAGLVMRELAPKLPFDMIILNEKPDGTFPNGVPNPLLPEKREQTALAVLEYGADFGIAWDGDFDRCFFYDAEGRFIEGYYLVGLLAETILARHPGEKIIHDPRLVWNTRQTVAKARGIAVECKSGHAFIKEKMRAENALYGGEMSAHHYFRDFSYCDSGMIPWLLIAQLLSDTGKTLSSCVEACMKDFPCSGEINSKVTDIKAVLNRVETLYGALDGADVSHTDGLTVTFADWRFNVRGSNTEPVLRLNVESRGNTSLMEQKTAELLSVIRS